MGADGIAFWYTGQSYAQLDGPTFGGPPTWNGLMISFDTFDNNGLGDNPVLAVFVNDGSWVFDVSQDGKGQELGSCRKFYRNYDTYVKVQYWKVPGETTGELAVYVKTPSRTKRRHSHRG